MSYESDPSGIGVGKTYGGRNLYEGSAGVTRTSGYENEMVIDFDYTNYDRVSKVLPEGAIILESYAQVLEAFTFTDGTDPDIAVGTAESAATNGAGVDLTSTGTVVGTLAGTWDGALGDDTTVAVEVSGSPTSVDSGKARVTVKYTYQGDLDGK
ncbi:MAG: hypothetical protein OQK25_07855 [Gammaproteobacteria bacterium]|nr:hypothetical protein [Gammaproteobacteria bacterium]MCW8982493.1 hypothetical protein [Gammaproteobacteria bacterium]